VRETYALHLLVTGDSEAARREQEKAAELAPGSVYHVALSWFARLYGMSAAEAADAAEGFAIARGLPDPDRWRMVGSAAVDGRDREEALAIVEDSDALDDYEEFQLRLALGDTEGFMEWLEEEWRAGAADLFRIGILPQYAPLRDDPRFVAIVRDLGLPNGYDPVTGTARWP
jgi:hypothetical protein